MIIRLLRIGGAFLRSAVQEELAYRGVKQNSS